MIRLRSPRDAAAGGLFLILAGILLYNAGKLDMGTASRMGPGYFPVMLAVVLGLLGLAILVNACRYDGPGIPAGEWKGLALVTASIVAFGALLEPLGFIGAVLASSVLCIAASRPFRPLGSVGLVLVLISFCCVVFVWALGMPVRLLP